MRLSAIVPSSTKRINLSSLILIRLTRGDKCGRGRVIKFSSIRVILFSLFLRTEYTLFTSHYRNRIFNSRSQIDFFFFLLIWVNIYIYIIRNILDAHNACLLHLFMQSISITDFAKRLWNDYLPIEPIEQYKSWIFQSTFCRIFFLTSDSIIHYIRVMFSSNSARI